MAWISFGALSCRKKKTWWQLASQCCWNRARPWHASELVSFLVGLRTYQHPGIISYRIIYHNIYHIIFYHISYNMPYHISYHITFYHISYHIVSYNTTPSTFYAFVIKPKIYRNISHNNQNLVDGKKTKFGVISFAYLDQWMVWKSRPFPKGSSSPWRWRQYDHP